MNETKVRVSLLSRPLHQSMVCSLILFLYVCSVTLHKLIPSAVYFSLNPMDLLTTLSQVCCPSPSNTMHVVSATNPPDWGNSNELSTHYNTHEPSILTLSGGSARIGVTVSSLFWPKKWPTCKSTLPSMLSRMISPGQSECVRVLYDEPSATALSSFLRDTFWLNLMCTHSDTPEQRSFEQYYNILPLVT